MASLSGGVPYGDLCSAGDAFHAVTGAEQQQVGRAAREQSVGDNADNVIEFFFHHQRAGDIHVVDVDDDVAVVRDKTIPVHRVAPEFYNLAADVAAGHGDDFHGQREFAQDAHFLGLIGDANKGFGDGGHNLFPGQGTATAFDQLQALVGFVGTVDVKLDFVDRVEVVHRNAVLFQSLSGRLGACDGSVEVVAVRRQVVDEKVGGAAGAHPDNAARFLVRGNVI